MGSANSGLQHSSAPDRNLLRLTQIVDSNRGGIAPHTSQLNIYDAAGVQLDGSAGVFLFVDTLVEANRGVELSLQLRVAVKVVPAEGLLDHH